jgi:hypothetical protein
VIDEYVSLGMAGFLVRGSDDPRRYQLTVHQCSVALTGATGQGPSERGRECALAGAQWSQADAHLITARSGNTDQRSDFNVLTPLDLLERQRRRTLPAE